MYGIGSWAWTAK